MPLSEYNSHKGEILDMSNHVRGGEAVTCSERSEGWAAPTCRMSPHRTLRVQQCSPWGYSMTSTASLRTEAEVAGILGISEHSLKRLRLAGQGPPFAKIGRFPRYHLGLLEEWIIAKSNQEHQQDKGGSGHRRQTRALEVPFSGPRPAARSGRDWTRSYKRKPRSRQAAQRCS